MNAPARRLVPVPVLVGSQIERFRRSVRAAAIREAIDVADAVVGPLWHVDTGVEIDARLRRLLDDVDQDQDEKDTRGDVQSHGGESTASNPARPRALPDVDTDRALRRARIGAFSAGARWARVAREAGASAS
ncbi:hypothetical protein DMA15_12480 [Streptomyces sp. WAC 01529]|uniref:hypothetical protein n=1 Tax=Streptomyces sp. WAC 01529 TaxID=2203205 RepID=UPI000F6DD524|nr:hypothetical protein [Streptomyces sp. WAC 01529]AZM53304.1 hypothetical protein DMA15_12480 [Streptomyces sp. WAC 01529]